MMWIFAAAMGLMLPPDQWAGLPGTPGFVVGYQQTAGDQAIEERVPQGETVEDWTRMITTLRFGGIANPEQLVGLLAPIWSDGCPGARTSPPKRSAAAGLVSFSGRLDCPFNPKTGKPETFLYRTFARGKTTHMVQAAFRHVPSGAELAWAQDLLDDVVLCTGASTHPQCRQ